MCPICIANAALTALGAASTGGIAALAGRQFIPREGARTMTQTEQTQIVSEAEWLTARKKLLAKEKEFTRQRDALSAERRKMPWVKIETEYAFEGPGGKQTLADLFDRRSQL